MACVEATIAYSSIRYGGVNSTWNLPQLVGWSRAKDFLLTGREIDSAEARECGLFNRVVERARLLETALKLAEKLRIIRLPARRTPSGCCV